MMRGRRDLLKIGGCTQSLTGVGYPTILGMYLFTVGTKITVTTAPKILARGLGIMTAKVGVATIFAGALKVDGASASPIRLIATW